MATADARRRWLRVGGPVAVLAVGAVALVTVALRDRPPAPPPAPDPVEVDAQSAYEFATLDEMVAASDLVVRARVVATERGDLLGADGNDPGGAGVVVREVTLEVDEVWWTAPGTPSSSAVHAGDQLLVAEEGWLATGEPLIVDGLEPSSVGDDGVWFLQPLPDGTDEGGPRYLVINAQGRYLVDNDGLTGAAGDDALVTRIDDLSAQELRAGVER
jgi:hypothetical protein